MLFTLSLNKTAVFIFTVTGNKDVFIFSVLSPAESTDLDIILDDAIVEAARKRCIYPKRILPHVVHAFKAERKLMVGLQKLPDLLIRTQLRKPTGPESKQEIPHILLCFEPMEIHALVPVCFDFLFLCTFCVFSRGCMRTLSNLKTW